VAGASKPEFPPLLKPGFHPVGLEGVRRLCVHRFPQSVTRPRIMQGLDEVVAMINRSGIRGEVWVDGSFLTDKLNPDDVDIILVLTRKDYDGLLVDQRSFFRWFRTTSLQQQYRCDNYGVVFDDGVPESEWLKAYWLRQFGFSRSDDMKGLAVIKVPFLVVP
jgi:hypothetical protein